MSRSTFRVDDDEQEALFRHYGQQKLDRIFMASARAGAKVAADALQRAAPIGTSRPSQFYRRNKLPHGTLASSVAARKIRKRGVQKSTIGFVVGPGGKFGFTRHWITGGTKPHLVKTGRGKRMQHPGTRANPWVARTAPTAIDASNRASRAVIVRYVSKIPGV
jgi:hypothetical protein